MTSYTVLKYRLLICAGLRIRRSKSVKSCNIAKLERILRTNLKSISTSMSIAFRYSHLKINTLQSTFKQHISTTAFFNASTDKKQASSQRLL